MEFAFVKPILTMLASQSFRDFLLKWKLDESLKGKLESYLKVIGAFLNYADDEQTENQQIKDWLDDVKDAVYDAEDLLDEILTSNSASETRSGSPSKIRNLLPSSVRRRMKSLRKGIQYKKRDIIYTLHPFREPIDDRMKSMVERLKTVSEQKYILELRDTDGKKLSRINERLTTSVIDEDNHIYGRDQDKEKIIKLLDQTEEGENNRVTVIVICGMGGLGKTALAQIVYNDLKKTNEMEFSVQAWACVSDTFNVKKTTKDLLESATGKPSTAGDNLELLQVALKEELRDKRFLLVLDDIWTHEYRDWEALSIPFSVGGHGSKIIVTTRDAKVIASIKHQVIPHELRTLEEDDCWALFERIAFKNGNSSDFPKLQNTGKQIVRKCKGLPLAAKTIAGLLRLKQEDEEQWEDVLNSSIWDSPNQEYLAALILSYRHLPVEERQCFAYCSLFPKDYRFRIEELVLLWVAEGFVSNADEHGNLEASGQRYFSNLLSMSFFQRYGDHESLLYVMHDLIHDLAQFVSGKSYLRKDEENEEGEKNSTSNNVRRFSFRQGFCDVFVKFKPISEVKCLRTFLPFRDSRIDTWTLLTNKVPNQLLPQMKFLRVLSLRGYHSVYQLPDSVGDLKHLRYLDLSLSCIKGLPDTINGLHNLQTLLLDGCILLERLSANMEGLVKLRHLRLDRTIYLTEMPMGIAKMTQLRTLSKFVVGENGSGITALKNLPNLQGRVHISRLSNVVKATDASDANFEQKKYLNEVILDWGDISSYPRNFNVEEEFMRKLRFHTNLTKLTIGGYGGKKFPEWIEDLTNLVYVRIYDCRYCEFLPSLGNLSRLKDLIIKGLDCIKSVDYVFYGNDDPFPSLETLKFEDMKDWEEWKPLADEFKGFPRLRVLSIDACPKLPNVSHRFMSLEILNIRNCGSLAAFSSSHDCPSLESLEIEGCKELLGLPRFERLRTLRLLKSNDELFGSVIDLSSNTGRLVDATSALSCLPRARELEISGCNAVVKMSNDQVGLQGFASLEELLIEESRRELLDLPGEMFSSLETVVFRKCFLLQKLPDQLGRLQSLRNLRLEECSEIVSFPDGGLPSMLKRLRIANSPRLETIPEGVLINSNLLEEIVIDDCSSLASFDGKLPTSLNKLSIQDCSSLQLLPQGLMSVVQLHIEGCDSLTSFPTTGSGSGGAGEGDLPMTIESLEIRRCKKLGSLPQSLPNLSSLRKLEFGSCPLIEHFPNGGLPITSLENIELSDCPRITQLPEGINRSSPLERLCIDRFPSLVSLPQLPRALKVLAVTKCERLGPVEDWGLDGLESLAEFRFGNIPSLKFLEDYKHLLPKTITNLYLDGLPNLKSMSNGLKNLTSLQHMSIVSCVKLKSLPDEGLPETLRGFEIRNCPLLKRRCEKGGADWSKLADIPHFRYSDHAPHPL